MTTPQTDQQAREIVSAALLAIVPDAPLDTLGDDADLRDALELDSLDYLNFIQQLSAKTGQPITEDDYDRLRTMATCTRFLRERTAA